MKLVLPLIHPDDSRPLYVQLYTFFIKEIRSGRMPYGTRLPSKRVLSRLLGISLNTVDYAYQQLLAEGYIESRPRKGMFVIYQDEHMNKVRVNDPVANEAEHQSREKIVIDFSHGQVDREHFPFQLIRKYYRQIFSPEGSIYFQNGPSQGSLPLRAEIARYLYQSRAVSCTPEQIVIGAGTQLLLGQLLSLQPDHMPFAMENPGFHRVRELVKQSNLELADIPVEPDGLDEYGQRIVPAMPSFLPPNAKHFTSDCQSAYHMKNPLFYTDRIEELRK
ncbi:aminotransferase class I/II-fold pyridoxal phosphate-dependent enzyme [Sporolactobacillus vineae]|uniref:aminotransferase class I/II-fold pyridoxal phosphate-dependent enzyme n=1 Tax=Sporolactobacillus vineae TaxID=444463 RepID=UPI0002893A24|nr:PLP-dependent aminotransferase family protein [Sporolactobacillus vineae]